MNSSLTDGWLVSEPGKYALLAALLSLSIRLISSILRSIEQYAHEGVRPFFTGVWVSFKGIDPDPKKGDYWFPYFIGFLEFACYPVLMRMGYWTTIGAWIALKTLAQWDYWKVQRPAFNRFLIGNALVAILSLLVMIRHVSRVP